MRRLSPMKPQYAYGPTGQLFLMRSDAQIRNAADQARFKAREREGLAVIRVEVKPEIVARTLTELLGYVVAEDRESLARGVERLLVDLAAKPR
jgi:hypothetical protein